ncbi:MAG: SH3 domain-containing protein [Anaerolineae bacterium]
MLSRFCLRGGVWLVLLLTMALPVMAQTETYEGQIVFICIIDDQWDICIVNPDGSGLLRLTDTPNRERNPTFSPDGTRIAFFMMSNRESNYRHELYIMQADGSGLHRIMLSNGSGSELSWSPDGTRIAFEYTYATQVRRSTYIFDLDSSVLRQITFDGGGSPSWSPDGGLLALALTDYTRTVTSRGHVSSQVNIMDLETGDTYRLTQLDMGVYSIRWSPDGEHIAFSTQTEDGWALYVMNTDGSHLRQLVNDSNMLWVSGWAPDGQQILMSTYNSTTVALSVSLVNITDGSSQLLLENAIDADWSANAHVTEVASPVTAEGNVSSGLWMETWAEDEDVCYTQEQRRAFAIQPFLLNVAEDGDELQVNYPLTGESLTLPRTEPDFYFGTLPGTGGAAFGESHVAWLTHMEYSFVEQFSDDCQIYSNAAWDFVTDGPYCTLTATANPNLRSGPATSYQQVGSLTAGDSTIAIAQATGDDGYVWYQLYDNKWVRSDLVEAEASCAELPTP